MDVSLEQAHVHLPIRDALMIKVKRYMRGVVKLLRISAGIHGAACVQKI